MTPAVPIPSTASTASPAGSARPGTASTGRSLPRRSSTAARLGLLIAVVLAVGDVVLGVAQLGAGETIPAAVGYFAIAAGVVTLVAVPLAWRMVRWATWLVIVVRLLSALTGAPAFFVPDVPAGLVIVAATGIVLAALVVVLLLIKPQRTTA